VADQPMLAATDAVAVSPSVDEDSSVGISITPQFETDLDATKIRRAECRPAGATLTNGIDTFFGGSGTLTLTPAQLAGLTLNTADDDTGSITLTVQAHAAEGATTADSAIQTITVTVSPVADQPMLAATDAVAVSPSVDEDSSVGISITPQFETDLDATNTITIDGLPAGATLTNGIDTFFGGSGTLTLTPAQLAGLTLTTADDDTASITLTSQAH